MDLCMTCKNEPASVKRGKARFCSCCANLKNSPPTPRLPRKRSIALWYSWKEVSEDRSYGDRLEEGFSFLS